MAGLTEGVQPRFVTSRVLGNRSILFPMKIMIWNCRGAGSDRFLRTIFDLVRGHDPTT